MHTYLDGGDLGTNGSATTVANLILPEADAHATSPVNGTIVQWRVVTLGTGQYALRVMRPAGGDAYTGVGISAQTISSPGSYTFAASLPIQAGDLIGMDLPDNNGIAATNITGGSHSTWVPSIPEGSPASPVFSNIGEAAFNADVQFPDAAAAPPPTQKKCKKKKHKRSASAAKKCKKKKHRAA
jgi:hypothetical protein